MFLQDDLQGSGRVGQTGGKSCRHPWWVSVWKFIAGFVPFTGWETGWAIYSHINLCIFIRDMFDKKILSHICMSKIKAQKNINRCILDTTFAQNIWNGFSTSKMEQENFPKLGIILEWIRCVLFYILSYFFSSSLVSNPVLCFCLCDRGSGRRPNYQKRPRGGVVLHNTRCPKHQRRNFRIFLDARLL